MAFIGDGVLSGDQIGRDQIGCLDASSNYVPLDRSLLTPLEVHQDRGYGTGIVVIISPVDISQVMDGLIAHTFGDENLFWRIWFEPVEYDAGFITEDRQFDIKVWNAYLDVLATISAISVLAQEGTSIDHDPVPITIPKFGDMTAEVTIYRVGPPLQNTVYTFTINAVDHTSTITGMRVIEWNVEPDWGQSIKTELSFETVLARNRFFKEQRRPLLDTPVRTVRLSAWSKGLDAQKVKQKLTYGHDKVFGVPIYSEPCYPTGTITGQTVINMTNDLTKFWNLNNLCVHVMIVDHEALVSEIKEVDSVGANSVTLVRSVTETFVAARTVVYPMFMAVLDSLTFKDETDDTSYVDVAFEEYVS